MPTPTLSSPLEQRLELGELICYPHCPFDLPQGDERTFLFQQQLRPLTHKNINYDPARNSLAGSIQTSSANAERLHSLLAGFSQRATAWLRQTLPSYEPGCVPDRASYHSEEEATRRLRLTARNDLLHIDAFPNRPSEGRRILRLYANINPTEPRVWVTADLFPRLLERFGDVVGLPGNDRRGWLRRLFDKGALYRSTYDSFMLRFHDFLKTSDEFQERSRKHLWIFPPGSAWLLFTDGCTYAELRGRYALDHSYFIEPRVLACPDQSPAALLEQAMTATRPSRAA